MLKSFRASAFLSAALLVFVTACGGGEQEAASPSAPASPAASAPASPAASPASPAASPSDADDDADGKTKYSYPPQVVKNFVDACTAGRGKDVEEVCTCAIKKIQDKYSLEEFTKFDQDVAKGGKPPEDMINMVKECRDA